METTQPAPALRIGQRVRTVQSEGHTPREGRVRYLVWHYKDSCYYYFIESGGKKISKRYRAEELEALAQPEQTPLIKDDKQRKEQTMGDEGKRTAPASENAKLTRLEPLVGAWMITVDYQGQPLDGGSAVFEWAEGGAFLRGRTAPTDPRFPSTSMRIGADDSSETYTMLYFDSRGVARVYLMSLEQGVWRLWRDAPGFAQRFTGRLSEDGRTIAASWEKATDGTSWELDFELTYTRADAADAIIAGLHPAT